MAKDKAAGNQPKKTNGDGPDKGSAQAEPEQGAQTKPSPQLTMLALYVKDLSFESPSAPKSLQGPGQNPQLRVNVNVNGGPRGDDTYETALQLEAHASSDLGVIYNVELSYGGLFRLRGVPEDLLQPVLFVDCATILFPFARRVLADAIRDGGFPPLLLDPIDFAKLYAHKFTPEGNLPAKN
jgi:preprotein translocase subunit SecB